MIKVSVIMPAYNAANTIEAAILSVINQVYKDWELIIVNDASRDATETIARRFVEKYQNISLINLRQNGGLSNARNTGISHGQGEFVAFLDSDDLWHPEKLQDQIAFHDTHPDYSISHTGFQVFNEHKIITRPWKFIFELFTPKSGKMLPHLYHKNNIGVLTVVIKRSILSETGLFDTNLGSVEDNDLWIRIAEKGYKFGYIDKSLAHYRVSAQSLSNSPTRYKKAFKTFIKKHSHQEGFRRNSDKIWGNYYRYFGTYYFKNGKYLLANKYFKKSIGSHKLSFISLTTLLFLVLSIWRSRQGRHSALATGTVVGKVAKVLK